MTLLRALAHKPPVRYFNFHGTGQPLPVMGSLGLEPSVGPAVAEVAPGAGAHFQKKPAWGSRAWRHGWTDGQSLSGKVMVMRQGGVAVALLPPLSGWE